MNTVHFTLLWSVHTFHPATDLQYTHTMDMQTAVWDAYTDMFHTRTLQNVMAILDRKTTSSVVLF